MLSHKGQLVAPVGWFGAFPVKFKCLFTQGGRWLTFGRGRNHSGSKSNPPIAPPPAPIHNVIHTCARALTDRVGYAGGLAHYSCSFLSAFFSYPVHLSLFWINYPCILGDFCCALWHAVWRVRARHGSPPVSHARMHTQSVEVTAARLVVEE